MTTATADPPASRLPPSSPLRSFLAKTEAPLLVLAGVAVAIYLGDITSLWARWGVQAPMDGLSLVIDLVFVTDLVLKIVVFRGAYLKTGWFFIDLVSSLPVLATLAAAPNALRAFRFVRSLRIFRLLRSLRSLRVLRAFRGLRVAGKSDESRESPAFHRALIVTVSVYIVLLLGAVELGRQADFGARGPEIFLVVGSLLGTALVLTIVRFQLPDLTNQQVGSLLNVALPEQVARRFMAAPETYSHSVRMPATVMFCDISGFTAAVEALGDDLDALKKNLEQCLDAVVSVHLEQDLIVDKFIGDAVMSFRGGDMVTGTPEEHARRVVTAALQGARALAAVNNPWFKKMKIGGASAPDVLIGTFGTSRRLSYTVLGDRVNLASRLEGQCGKFDVPNIFDEDTRKLAGDFAGVVWRRIGRVRVQGKTEPIRIFEAVDATSDTAWVEPYEAAQDLFHARQFAAAAAAFAAVDAARGEEGDGPSRLYRAESERLAEHGAPEDWEPILQTKKS
jgi:class 3 adenylate cyclase